MRSASTQPGSIQRHRDIYYRVSGSATGLIWLPQVHPPELGSCSSDETTLLSSEEAHKFHTPHALA